MNKEEHLTIVGNPYATDEIPARPAVFSAVYIALKESKRRVALLKW